MWIQDRFSWKGNCFSMPERAVLPKPIQQPHPPMRVTVTSAGTELDAAERGPGCLGVATASLSEQERRTKRYHQRIQQSNPVGVVNDQVATLNFMYCHDDLQIGAKRGMSFLGMFGMLNLHLLFTREANPTTGYPSLGGWAAPRSSKGGGNPGAAYGVPDGMCIGDPSAIIEAIKRWESRGARSSTSRIPSGAPFGWRNCVSNAAVACARADYSSLR